MKLKFKYKDYKLVGKVFIISKMPYSMEDLGQCNQYRIYKWNTNLYASYCPANSQWPIYQLMLNIN